MDPFHDAHDQGSYTMDCRVPLVNNVSIVCKRLVTQMKIQQGHRYVLDDGGSVFKFWQRQILSCHAHHQESLWCPTILLQNASRDCALGLKRLGFEGHKSPQSTADTKNVCRFLHSPACLKSRGAWFSTRVQLSLHTWKEFLRDTSCQSKIMTLPSSFN